MSIVRGKREQRFHMHQPTTKFNTAKRFANKRKVEEMYEGRDTNGYLF